MTVKPSKVALALYELDVAIQKEFGDATTAPFLDLGTNEVAEILESDKCPTNQMHKLLLEVTMCIKGAAIVYLQMKSLQKERSKNN